MGGETLKQRVENNLTVVVIGLIVLSGGTVAGITGYFSSIQRQAASDRFDSAQQQCTAQIRDLENKLTSIDRNPAGGEYMDIRKFAVSRAGLKSLPATSKFHSDDLFYAPDPAGWTYKRITDAEFFKSIYGEEEAKNKATGITALAPLNVWQRGDFVPVKNQGIINNIAPCIWVQSVPAAEMVEQLNLRSRDDTADGTRLGTMFQGDIIGAMLNETLSTVFTGLRFASETNVNLLNISKVSNVLYCQILLTLNDVTVGPTHFARYYVIFETIVISARDRVYTFCDFQPSDEPVPRGAVPAEVTAFLNNFTILSE